MVPFFAFTYIDLLSFFLFAHLPEIRSDSSRLMITPVLYSTFLSLCFILCIIPTIISVSHPFLLNCSKHPSFDFLRLLTGSGPCWPISLLLLLLLFFFFASFYSITLVDFAATTTTPMTMYLPGARHSSNDRTIVPLQT